MIITLDSIKLDNNFIPSETYDGRVLLFLDFDGVLHAYEQGYKRDKDKIFIRNHFIEDILRKMPNVEVVISSNWSKTCSLNILKNKFSEDVRHRFIGHLRKHTTSRSDDVRTYMETHGEVDVPWVAVDDLAYFHDTDPVIRTSYKTGLMEDSCKALENALSSPIEYKKYKETI
jgi:hypothetical protein